MSDYQQRAAELAAQRQAQIDKANQLGQMIAQRDDADRHKLTAYMLGTTDAHAAALTRAAEGAAAGQNTPVTEDQN